MSESAIWTKEDQELASMAGWGIFDIDALGKEYQLQKCDESERFARDENAWSHVYAKAQEGGGLEGRALAFLRQHSPAELANIEKWASLKAA